MNKIDKKNLEDVLELVWDYTEYEIEGNRYTGYDITPSMTTKSKAQLLQALNAHLLTKRNWKFWRNK